LCTSIEPTAWRYGESGQRYFIYLAPRGFGPLAANNKKIGQMNLETVSLSFIAAFD
jgi:hypothetical protein